MGVAAELPGYTEGDRRIVLSPWQHVSTYCSGIPTNRTSGLAEVM